ncbi:DUF6069 family protein [Salininema proteolyticum]|uniref:DUF6069 family protein n=1 Tax=Salininema proteolyticum TaxID=1607685 RepID=A0ABV8U0J8_9ACTN
MTDPTRRFQQPEDHYEVGRYSGDGGSKSVNAGRLWAGGAAAAVVAALVALVGILLIRGVLSVDILAPAEAGAYGTATTTTYVVVSAAAALAATALLHLLLISVPDPRSFFNWIVVLATLAAAIVPWTVYAGYPPKIATSLLNLVIGLSILSILNSVGSSAARAFQGNG